MPFANYIAELPLSTGLLDYAWEKVERAKRPKRVRRLNEALGHRSLERIFKNPSPEVQGTKKSACGSVAETLQSARAHFITKGELK